jgi:carboxypeptidase family protein/TonB-dependent receptor-like protein
MRRIGLLLSLALCLFAFTAMVWAQSTGGNIRGVVNDSEGKPLPGVTVTIASKALLGGTRTTYTNELGVFRFPSLPVGIYSVDFAMEGFDKVSVSTVNVGLDQTANVPVSMNFAKMTETVTIMGETPLIDVTDSQNSTSYSGPILEEVPTQHSEWLLMQMTPGVSQNFGDAGGDRTIAFGSNQQSNAWHVDGMDLSAPETGSTWLGINPDLIQEVQVVANGGAEYGNHMGAVFNVVTKKGSNEVHGGANYYFLNDDLTADNVDLGTGSDSDVFHRLDWRQVTAQVGGPMIKDKLWWFGGFQSYRDASSQPGVDPTYAEQVTYKTDKYDAKINSLLGEKHEVSGFFHWDNWDSPNTPSPFVAPSALAGEGGQNPAWGASWTWSKSENTLVEAGYSGWSTTDLYDSVIGAPLQDPFIDYTPPGGGPTTYSGGVYYTWDYKTWRSTFRGKVTQYADNFLKAQHEFKFGVQYSKGSNDSINGLGPNGFYTYNYYGYLYKVEQTPWQYGSRTDDLGFFIDDSVTINDRLTLNLGVRFDHDTGRLPDYQRLEIGDPSITPVGHFKETGQNIPGQDVVDWNLVSPRLGFVWQPEKQVSKVTGTFGVYYDHDVSGNWDYPPPAFPPLITSLFNPDTGQFEEVSQTFTDLVPAANIDPPRALNYSIGYDRQLGNTMAFGAQYIYKTTKDMVGWNSTGGTFSPVDFVDPFTGQHYTLIEYAVDADGNFINPPTLSRGNSPGDICDHAPWASECANGGLGRYHQKYHGVLFTFEKRFSDSWALNMNYTWSRSTGLSARPLSQFQNNPSYGSKDGGDLVNQYLNAEGRQQGDRPHMFRIQGVFNRLPLGLNASVLADFESGRYYVRQIRVGGLTQGSTRVILEQNLRLEAVKSIDVTVGRKFPLGAGFVVRLDGTIYNILNSDTPLELASLRLQSPDEQFIPDFWTQPRRLEIRAGFQF